jgi:hypothetical protein
MKWWRWRVTLPHSPACKAGAFLVCHIPVACRPGAAPDLGGFGDLPAQAGARHVKWCGQPVTLRRLNDGVVASWLLDHGRIRNWCPAAASRRPSGPPLTAGLHNKERTPLRALVSRTRRYFTADVSVFQAHLPCDHLPIFSYRTKA